MDAEFIRDLFASFRPVTVRRMFGGAGIYADAVMFALIADDVIYLKAGESNEADFLAEDLPPFTYEAGNGKRAIMSYRRMPDRLYDDPDELAQWAARALAAALSKSKPRQKTVKRAAAPKAKTAARQKTATPKRAAKTKHVKTKSAKTSKGVTTPRTARKMTRTIKARRLTIR